MNRLMGEWLDVKEANGVKVEGANSKGSNCGGS